MTSASLQHRSARLMMRHLRRRSESSPASFLTSMTPSARCQVSYATFRQLDATYSCTAGQHRYLSTRATKFDVFDPSERMSYNMKTTTVDEVAATGTRRQDVGKGTPAIHVSLKGTSNRSTYAEFSTFASSAWDYKDQYSSHDDEEKTTAAASSTLHTVSRAERPTNPSYCDSIIPEVDSIPPRLKKWTPQLTKIVATVGPTSEQLPVMQELVASGLRVMRLNFSHATVEEVELRVKNLQACQGLHGAVLPGRSRQGNVRAVLLDTRGPEIRTGKLRDDHTGKCTVHFTAGDKVTLQTSDNWKENGSTASDLYVDYANVAKCLHPGMKVLLDDGAITLTVESVNVKHGTVECVVDNSGELRSRAGVNLPGADTDLPAMSEKDKVDIKYGITKDVDYVAASFIQNAAGVHEIRNYMKDVMTKELHVEWGPTPLIISKIESISALKNFDEILEASDGIMVARGDLGVEIPIQQITNAQKEIIAACNAAGKPVIVATQMLESMAKNPRPTRAEVADVTNAVYDGADAVMLSGETAKGKYPVESVKMMNEIIMSAEKFAQSRPKLSGFLGRPADPGQAPPHGTSHFSSIAKACVTASKEQNAAAIIALTKKGAIVKKISSFRPNVPILAFCPNEKVARQLMLHRGVHPVVGLSGVSPHKRPAAAIKDAKALGFVQEGDDVVIVTGESIEDLDDALSMRVATVV